MSARLVRLFSALAAFVVATLLLFVPPFIESLSHKTEVSAAPVLQEVPTLDVTPEPIAEVTVDLTTNRLHIEAGETVTYTMTITNTTDKLFRSVVFNSPLPASTRFVDSSSKAVTYNSVSGEITWAVGDVLPNTILTVSYQIQTLENESNRQLVAGVEASSPDFTEPLKGWNIIDVGTPPNNTTWITPDGGMFAPSSGDIQLIVPKGALEHPLRFEFTPLTTALPNYIFAGYELSAWADDKTQVTTFSTPLTLIGNVRPYWEAFTALEGGASFYSFNESMATWDPIPSEMDLATGYVTAEIHRFDTYALGGGGGATFGVDHLPTIHRFGNDEWSGNSSAGYPLTLPPAPGNLPFGLSLAYSSEGVNALFAGDSSQHDSNLPLYMRQASHVGWGWALSGLGSIQVVDRATHEAYLNFPGGSQKITRPTNGDAWSWQTDPQTFVRINSYPTETAKYATKWVVYSMDGLRYTFGADNWAAQSVAFNRDITFNCSSNAAVARQLYLTEIRDTHDNYIEIQYTRNDRDLDPDVCPGDEPGDEEDYIRDTRPISVTYYAAGTPAQPTAQIEFRYGSRTDLGIEKWDDDRVQSLYSDQRLEAIEISVVGPTGFEPARKYSLGYQYVDFPNYTDPNKQLLTLVSVTDQGKNWSDGSALPSHSFTYTRLNSSWTNSTVLYTATNGYGGEVEYQYNSTGNFQIDVCNPSEDGLVTKYTSRYYVRQMRTFDGLSSGAFRTVILNATSPYAVASSSSSNTNCTRDFEFGGYGAVGREVQNATGTVVQRGVNHYYQTVAAYLDRVAPQAGKPRYIQMLTPANVLLAQETLTWTATTSLGTPWVSLTSKVNEVFGTPSVTSRTDYVYSATVAGGYPYGLPTLVTESVNGSVYRKTETEYVEDTINLRFLFVPRQSKILDATTNCLGITLFAYDNNNNYSTTPIHGHVTASKTAQDNCSTGPWLESQSTYDAWGNQISVTDPRNYTTNTAYDTSGAFPRLYAYPLTVTLPAVTAGTFRTVYQWNKYLGQVEQVVDKANNTTLQNYSYDEFGRATEVTTPEYGRVKYVYPPTTSTLQLPYRVQVHTLLNVTSPGTWQYQHQFYDGLGRGIEVRTSYQGTTTHTVTYAKYHALGGVEYAYAPIERAAATTYVTPDQWNGQPYTFTKYDALGRPIALRAMDNTTTTMSYGTATLNTRPLHLQTVQDPRGTTVRHYTDALGRMTAVQEMTGTNGAALYATTLYTYTATDLLDKVKDQSGNITDINYDLLGRKTSMDDPDMGYWQYRYDSNSNLIAQLDANNNGICFQFDALNRSYRKRVYMGTTLTTVLGCGTSGVSYEANYTYDGDIKGLRSGMSDPTGTTAWDYDVLGRVIREDKTIIHNSTNYNFATAYTYDQIGRVKSMTYMPSLNGTETVNYTYDAPYIGALNGVASSSPAIAYASNMQYNRYGQMTAMTYGTSTSRQITYGYHPLAGTAGSPGESQGRLAQITVAGVWLQQYEYDLIGNVEKLDTLRYHPEPEIPDEYQETLFTYDPLNRLTSAATVYGTAGAYNEAYKYNTIGNMTVKNGVNYTYSASQPHAVTALSNNNTYVYDAVGNQKYRRYYNIGGTHLTDTLTYDGENRLISIDFGDSVIQAADYSYDGDGNRVKATISGQTTLYVGAHMEYRITGNVLVKYYYAGSQRIAMREGINLPYFFISDHLGSTALTLSQNGNVYSEMRYKPFGETAWSSATATPTRRRYTGQIQDFDTAYMNLYFYNARYYDPVLGRFTQADTIVPEPGDPQSFNRFSYVGNNPLKYTDPTGHYEEDDLKRVLGEDWYNFYFGKGGVFEGRDDLLAFLRSGKTQDIPTLEHIVKPSFEKAQDLWEQGWVIESIGYRGNVGYTAAIIGGAQAGVDFDLVFNLISGEIDFFVAPGAGPAIGTPGLGAGMSLLFVYGFKKGNVGNDAYGGVAYSIGIGGGYYAGAQLEHFISSPSSTNTPLSGDAVGVYFGVGAAIYESASYAFKVMEYDKDGYALTIDQIDLGVAWQEYRKAIYQDFMSPWWPK